MVVFYIWKREINVLMKSILCPVIVYTKLATSKDKYLHCICKPGERYRLQGLFVLHVLLTIQTILDVVWLNSLG